jgi:hypothetical protein
VTSLHVDEGTLGPFFDCIINTPFFSPILISAFFLMKIRAGIWNSSSRLLTSRTRPPTCKQIRTRTHPRPRRHPRPRLNSKYPRRRRALTAVMEQALSYATPAASTAASINIHHPLAQPSATFVMSVPSRLCPIPLPSAPLTAKPSLQGHRCTIPPSALFPLLRCAPAVQGQPLSTRPSSRTMHLRSRHPLCRLRRTPPRIPRRSW